MLVLQCCMGAKEEPVAEEEGSRGTDRGEIAGVVGRAHMKTCHSGVG